MVPITQEDQVKKPANTGGRQGQDHERRHSRSQYRWTLKTLTQCSRSCGGGYQRTLALCVKKSGQRVVPDRKCQQWNKPAPRTMRCNRSPCPAEWVAGEWGMCSTTCGEGMQKRRVACRQELSETLAIPVAQELCTHGHNYVTERKCFVTSCDYGLDERLPTVSPVGGVDLSNSYQNYQAWNNVNHVLNYKTQTNDGEKVNKLTTRKGRTYFPKNPSHLNGYKDSDNQNDNKITRSQVAASATWIAQPWGSCSVSCGSGVKERRVSNL